MKISKTNSLLRLVAFLLITVVLVGVVGIVSEGMEKEPTTNDTALPDAPIITPPATDIPAVLERYENYLSGLSCSMEDSKNVPLCYMMSPMTSLYGIKDAELTIEFPLENGQTRLLVYTSKTMALGKIGSVSPMRKFISPFLSSFGGILVHNGIDDTVSYSSQEVGNTIDLSKSNAYSYTEGQGQVHTNGKLISSALENLQYITTQNTKPSLPYTFPDLPEVNIHGTYQGQNITIPFGTQNKTQLIYDISAGAYRYESNGQTRTDFHNGEIVTYKNVFILFSDSTTYERADTTELVFECTEGGAGYYFTNGSMLKFIWTIEDGNMVFKDLSGNKLVINRGNSYLSLYKTTQKNSILIY